MAEDRIFASSQRAVLDEFGDKLQQNTLIGDCGRRFVRVKKLTAWMRTGANVKRLLEAVYPSNDSMVRPPISPTTVNNRAILVFSVLLDLGQGELIDVFDRKDFHDSRLPFRKWDLLELYKELVDTERCGEDATQLAERFSDRQYAFCPVVLQYNHAKDHLPDSVIPVMDGHKTIINDKGGTASVWQISVLEEFVADELRSAIMSSQFEDPKDDLGPRYRLVLKVFQQDNRQFYETEKEAFKALADHDGMVKYLGEYCQKDVKKETTSYYILLEYGQLDLDEFFFEDALPPALPQEIHEFWRDIFDIAGALKKLHNITVRREDASDEYYGWHADLKPDNILQVNGKFKLADPGFASFKKIEGKKMLKEKQRIEHYTVVKGGTVTYGAPECHFWKKQYNKVKVTRAIDIWSLGCVLSVAATWVVLGSQGILQFQRLRELVIMNLREEQVDLVLGDYFHNGTEVLPIVTDWHKYLRCCKRESDTVTGRVLDLIDEKMLCKDQDNRITAKDLETQLQSLLEQNRPGTTVHLSETFRDALREMDLKSLQEMDDKNAPRPRIDTKSKSPLPTNEMASAEERKAKKSRFLAAPLKPTTHRSDALRLPASNLQNSSSTRRERSNLLVPQDLAPELLEPNGSYLNVANFDHSTGSVFDALLTVNQNARYSGSSPTRASLNNVPSGKTSSTLRDSKIVNPKSASAPPESGNVQRHGTEDMDVPRITRAATAPPPIPKLNAFQARAELDRQKTMIGTVLRQLPKKAVYLTQYFDNRDLHFLVDDADSMLDSWDEAAWLLGILVDKAVGQDPNGMDMSFTHSDLTVRDSNKAEKFHEKMEKARHGLGRGHLTDIRKSLDQILDAYLQDLQKANLKNLQKTGKHKALKDLRKLTIVILTDGRWEGMRNKHDIGKTIANFAKKMEQFRAGSLQARQVSFQFIQFGKDEEARYRLQRLDDDLPYEEAIPDIVDTTESSGDVHKMLLGSFRPEYDELD